MIDEKKLIAKLEGWAEESREEAGLKEPALLEKVIKEVKDMAVNEEIKARIERDSEQPKPMTWSSPPKNLKPNRKTDTDSAKVIAKPWRNNA